MNTSIRAATEDALRGVHTSYLCKCLCVLSQYECQTKLIYFLVQCVFEMYSISPQGSLVVLEHVIIARRPQEAVLDLEDVEVAIRQDMEEPVALEGVRIWTSNVPRLNKQT